MWLSFTAAAVNCALQPRKKAIFRLMFNSFKLLSIVKPWSAITLSLGDQSFFSIKSHFLTISLSESEPSCNSLKNVTEPE